MFEPYRDKRILITGVAGTVGRELLRQLVGLPVASVAGVDRDESGLFFLDRDYRNHSQVELFIGDVCDPTSCERHMQGIDIVFHTAALKQVELCERSPAQVQRVNVDGLVNVIDAARAGAVERVVFTSSDKAVEPCGVMGQSKRAGERLMHAAARQGGPALVTLRFGNVLGSSGSVLPLFMRQIRGGGPVTLTDAAMTRFIASAREVVGWMLREATVAASGDIVVKRMRAIAIADLAHVVIEELAPRFGLEPDALAVETSGPRAGEKLHESLLGTDELGMAQVQNASWVVPAHAAAGPVSGEAMAEQSGDFHSADADRLQRDALRRWLANEELLG